MIEHPSSWPTTAGSSHPAIELRHVRKCYGDLAAVDGVSLRVEPGEFLTLLGPSGGGKTTTLRLIGGFERPTEGEVTIAGLAMGDQPPERRPVSTVFQHYALFPHMTVGRNVGYGLEAAGVGSRERERRVAAALELVRLPGFERRRPADLSGGQRQRVALARALVNRPAVLLLDEPLGALDLGLRQAMQTELRRLNRETGATFLHVTHDQGEALALSDRVAVMRDGRLLQVGTPAEIYERPRCRFVAAFVGDANLLEVAVERVDGPVAELHLTGAGRLRAVVDAPVAAGQRRTLVVRPERLSLAAAPAPPGWNEIGGTVVESVYLGPRIRLRVRLTGGAVVVVDRPNGAADDRPANGEEVRLAFDPAAAILLGE